MKRIALMLAFLLLLSALVACDSAGGAETTAAADETSGPAEDTTAAVEGTTEAGAGDDEATVSEPDDETTVEPVGSESESATGETEPTDEGEASETVGGEDEEVLFTLTVNGNKYYPVSCLYREGSFGTAGGEDRLPMIAQNLPVVAYSDTMTFIPKAGGSITHIKVFNTDYSQKASAAENDPSVFEGLADGVYYVIVGVTFENAELDTVDCYEFAFTLAVGIRLFAFDGTSFALPSEVAVGSETYNAENDAWTSSRTEGVTGTLSSIASSLPTVIASEDLRCVFVGEVSQYSLFLYNESFTPVSLDDADFASIHNCVQFGTYYLVVRVDWTGDYVEAYERSEIESCDYAFCIEVG